MSYLRLPYFSLRPAKAAQLLDSTCFSSGELDDLADFDTNPESDAKLESPSLNLFPSPSPTGMPPKKTLKPEDLEAFAQKQGLSNGSLDTQARYTHPTFIEPTFLTAVLQPERFKTYIEREFPSPILSASPTTGVATAQDTLRKDVNATMANTLLDTTIPTNIAKLDYIRDYVFPDHLLPTPFKDSCLDDEIEIWDKELQQFTFYPDNPTEESVEIWLNHLAHTMGVHLGVIKEDTLGNTNEGPNSESRPKESAAMSVDGASGINTDVGAQAEGSPGDGTGLKGKGFVIPEAADRTFSKRSHQKGPSGGYRLRKPDITLLNRNLATILEKNDLRARWTHVEAIIEVSSSASPESMTRQIFEKAALMFEAQPFRRFAVALALRGTGTNFTFCFYLIDHSGVCLTQFRRGCGYDGVHLARTIFAMYYVKPEVLGIDTTMTRDLLTGDVTHIKVDNRVFTVVKHIYASLVLFGRGTHVFLVQDTAGTHYILKDAWLLVEHGISEISILAYIQDHLDKINGSSRDANSFRSLHRRYVAGKELGDSTKARRGRLVPTPPGP